MGLQRLVVGRSGGQGQPSLREPPVTGSTPHGGSAVVGNRVKGPLSGIAPPTTAGVEQGYCP
ncbi:MAG TPA: hypothetical protein VD902_19935 [Symbiobacteriaceae bacterium]|nr:hypothetical protein [Symbiobacteriaceae bacterium]